MKTHTTLAALAALAAITLAPLFAQETAKPDAQMQAVLDAHASLESKPIESLTPDDARDQPLIDEAVQKVMKERDLEPEEVGDITNTREVELEDRQLDARLYTPEGEGPWPVILYIHGGGWVIADINTYDASGRALCNAANAVVVATHYRQAPEHPFPAAHDDVFAAYEWVLKTADKFKGDPTRVAVAGESAGGNMACAVSMMAKEKGIQMPVHQLLVYPVADMSGAPAASVEEHALAKPLNKAMLTWFGKHLLANPEDAKDPRLSPVLAGDKLKGLPSTTILLAGIDPLRSGGEMLAEKLKEAGVPVNLKTYEGVTHEFFGMGGVVDKAKEAVAVAGADLKAAFAKTSASSSTTSSQ